MKQLYLLLLLLAGSFASVFAMELEDKHNEEVQIHEETFLSQLLAYLKDRLKLSQEYIDLIVPRIQKTSNDDLEKGFGIIANLNSNQQKILLERWAKSLEKEKELEQQLVQSQEENNKMRKARKYYFTYCSILLGCFFAYGVIVSSQL